MSDTPARRPLAGFPDLNTRPGRSPVAPLTYSTTPTGTTNHSIEVVVGQPITHWVSVALTGTGRVKIAAPAHQNPALNYALLRAALHRLECVNHDCPDCAQHP